MRSNSRVTSRVFVSLTFCVVLEACGCGGKQGDPAGNAAGKVTFGGEPLSEGAINFRSIDTGKGGTAKIAPDGSYTVLDLPVGNYQVLVLPPEMPAPRMEVQHQKRDESKFPRKYRLETTTDLKADIKEGENSFDFDMKR